MNSHTNLDQSMSQRSYLISSCKIQLLHDHPMTSLIEFKRELGYWALEDTDILSNDDKDFQFYILRNSIFMLLILESENA